ncbi:MAG: hypothetical protein PSV16_08625 [Flavobacterium sp.]|nr:hypothetical protein [Flavobacterium sp.]
MITEITNALISPEAIIKAFLLPQTYVYDFATKAGRLSYQN